MDKKKYYYMDKDSTGVPSQLLIRKNTNEMKENRSEFQNIAVVQVF